MTGEEHDILDELRTDIREIYIMLRGDNKGQLGLLQQVRFMWKAFWLWPLCTLSSIGGATALWIVQKLIGHP